MLKPRVSFSTTSYRSFARGRTWLPPTPAARLRGAVPGSIHSWASCCRVGGGPERCTLGRAHAVVNGNIAVNATTAEAVLITDMHQQVSVLLMDQLSPSSAHHFWRYACTSRPW